MKVSSLKGLNVPAPLKYEFEVGLSEKRWSCSRLRVGRGKRVWGMGFSQRGEERMSSGSKGGVVLVVAKPEVCGRIREMLSGGGHAIITAEPEQAVSLLRTPDTIVEVLITAEPQRLEEFCERAAIVYIASSPDLGWVRRPRHTPVRIVPDDVTSAVLRACVEDLLATLRRDRAARRRATAA